MIKKNMILLLNYMIVLLRIILITKTKMVRGGNFKNCYKLCLAAYNLHWGHIYFRLFCKKGNLAFF